MRANYRGLGYRRMLDDLVARPGGQYGRRGR
jgi:hypothetical protein